MKIQVKELTGTVTDYEVEPTESVLILKYRIEEGSGKPVDQQRLIFSGMQMEDDRALESYGISEGGMIHLVLRLMGD